MLSSKSQKKTPKAPNKITNLLENHLLLYNLRGNHLNVVKTLSFNLFFKKAFD